MPTIPAPPVLRTTSLGDPYTPMSGNTGYSVSHYDLRLDYRMLTNRLAATATITATPATPLTKLSFDFAGLSVERLTVDGQRP